MACLSFPTLPIYPHSGNRGTPILPTPPRGDGKWETGREMPGQCNWYAPAREAGITA